MLAVACPSACHASPRHCMRPRRSRKRRTRMAFMFKRAQGLSCSSAQRRQGGTVVMQQLILSHVYPPALPAGPDPLACAPILPCGRLPDRCCPWRMPRLRLLMLSTLHAHAMTPETTIRAPWPPKPTRTTASRASACTLRASTPRACPRRPGTQTWRPATSWARGRWARSGRWSQTFTCPCCRRANSGL
jgi:hypothetical protein